MIFDGDRDELGKYVRNMADLMGLRDWHLKLMNDPPDDPEAAACCEVIYGQKYALIRFHRDWTSADPEELRSTVIHELIHCHVEPMRWSVNNVKHVVGTAMFEVIFDAFSDALEVAVDGMARAWAESMPLPVNLEMTEEAA
jgi:hypothetical protein